MMVPLKMMNTGTTHLEDDDDDDEDDDDNGFAHLEETPTARTSSPGSKLIPLSSLGEVTTLLWTSPSKCFCF